jgi:hypothetical protein
MNHKSAKGTALLEISNPSLRPQLLLWFNLARGCYALFSPLPPNEFDGNPSSPVGTQDARGSTPAGVWVLAGELIPRQ